MRAAFIAFMLLIEGAWNWHGVTVTRGSLRLLVIN